MPSPSLTSPRTGPTLTAAGRRLKARTTMPRTTSPRCRRLLVGGGHPSIVPEPRRQSARPRSVGGGCEDRRMREITDDAAARATGHPARPGRAGGVGRAGRRGGDLPARHRGAQRLPLRGGPVRRDPRGHRHGPLRRPFGGQAARDAPHPVHLPARPAARRCGGARRTASPSSSRPGWPRRSRRTGSPSAATPGSSGCTRTIRTTLAEGGPATTAELREQIPALAPTAGAVAGQGLRRQLPDRPARARHAGRHRGDPPR